MRVRPAWVRIRPAWLDRHAWKNRLGVVAALKHTSQVDIKQTKKDAAAENNVPETDLNVNI